MKRQIIVDAEADREQAKITAEGKAQATFLEQEAIAK